MVYLHWCHSKRLKVSVFKVTTNEPERRDPGDLFFFSQKFDLINLFLRLGHSSLLNVSCAQILPRNKGVL